MRLAGDRALAMPGVRLFTLWRYAMIKTLIAVAVAGAFALPVAALASAASDNIVVAQAGGGAGGADAAKSNPQAGSNPPGTASTGASGMSTGFDRLDKNRDGFISRDEAKDAAELNTRFSELDKDNDGKLSREEYNALDTSARGATGAASGSTTRPLGSGDGKTGATPK